MGDIEEGVSHFLCPEQNAWLPKQRYDDSLDNKRQRRKQVAEQWIQGLSDGTYRTRSDIARVNCISRAHVTQLLNEYHLMNQV